MISHISLGYNGRLGNQLFIYALLYKLLKLGKQPSIPIQNLNIKENGCYDNYHNKWIKYRYVLDDYFNLSIGYSDKIPQNVWKEPKQGFHPEVFDLDNVSLEGYFQSWKYFDDVRDELINDEITFKRDITDKIDPIYDKYKDKETVAVHIRLGDTLAQPWMHKMDPEYINKAFALLESKDYNFLIFSDNLEYCKNWFPEQENIYFAEELNEGESLYLISKCDHFIMSASTFSWWGAYLGQKPHSNVIFPDYFDGTDRNLNDFYHPTWKRIKI